jgi:hypothetical protein
MDASKREPGKSHPLSITLGGALIVLTATAIGAVVLVRAVPCRTAGARASTRLQWEERRAEIDDAVRRAEAEGKR